MRIRPSPRLYPTRLFSCYCVAALPGWLIVGYAYHFRAGVWYGALIIIVMGVFLAWLFGGLSASASREVEVSPFVLPDEERPQIESMLAQVGMRPKDIYVTQDHRLERRTPNRSDDYPIIGTVTARVMSPMETAVLGLRWKVEHTEIRSSGWRIPRFIALLGLGYGFVAPCLGMKEWWGLSLLSIVNVLPVGFSMMFTFRESTSCVRLAKEMLNAGCQPETLLTVYAKSDYILYGYRPRAPLKPLRLRLPKCSYLAYLVFGFFRLLKFPVRREDSVAVLDPQPVAQVELKCSVRNLKGEIGQRFRSVAEAGGISEDRLREIVVAAVEECEARLQVADKPQ